MQCIYPQYIMIISHIICFIVPLLTEIIFREFEKGIQNDSKYRMGSQKEMKRWSLLYVHWITQKVLRFPNNYIDKKKKKSWLFSLIFTKLSSSFHRSFLIFFCHGFFQILNWVLWMSALIDQAVFAGGALEQTVSWPLFTVIIVDFWAVIIAVITGALTEGFHTFLELVTFLASSACLSAAVWFIPVLAAVNSPLAFQLALSVTFIALVHAWFVAGHDLASSVIFAFIFANSEASKLGWSTMEFWSLSLSFSPASTSTWTATMAIS